MLAMSDTRALVCATRSPFTNAERSSTSDARRLAGSSKPPRASSSKVSDTAASAENALSSANDVPVSNTSKEEVSPDATRVRISISPCLTDRQRFEYAALIHGGGER